MRQLLPTAPDDITMEALDLIYANDARPRPATRPWILSNMIVSTDGATAIGGRSGQLGGPADWRAFHALRAVADVIMVGAGTARAEHYGPPKVTEEQQARRVARGQAPVPRIALITGRLDLDLGSALFVDSPVRPLVFTGTRPSADQLAAASEVADVIIAGTDNVDLVAATVALHDLGVNIVLSEGGPTLNGHLAEADLFDEKCVTIAPLLVGGSAPRSVHDADLAHPLDLRLDRVIEDDGMLLLRYVRAN